MANKILKASDVTEVYKPTSEELKNIVSKPDSFKMTGDGAFYTVQGEGQRVGTPTTFVRLHFCNLACTWCDTWYSWMTTTPEYYREPFDILITDLHQVIREAQLKVGIQEKDHVYNVTFTGGEPLIQQLKIIEFLRIHPEYTVQIETNGTVMPKDELFNNPEVAFNSSPKLASSGNPHLRRYKPEVIKKLASKSSTCFKFVCSNEEDIENALAEYGDMIPRNMFYIMPEGVTKEENTAVFETIMPIVLKKGLPVSARYQNVMFDGSKRGV